MALTTRWQRAGRRLADGILSADRFVRLHFLFFTALWPVLGAASVRQSLAPAELAGLLAVVACFHVYAFVLNDVVDLPIDRTNPDRRHDPLVRGAITRRQALAVALAQPVLTMALTAWLGGGAFAQTTMLAAYALMGAYNVWGKRCRVPPITDTIQGLGWGALAVYAATVFGGGANVLAWTVAAFATLFTLFMNGIHGGLRDLETDLASGAYTTAIFFGARPSPAGDPRVPDSVAVFASIVLAGLIATDASLVVRNDFGYSGPVLAATAAAIALLNLVAIALMPKVVKPRGRVWHVAFRLQMYVVLMCLLVAFAASLSIELWLILGGLKLLSLALLECTPAIAAWVWQTMREATRPAVFIRWTGSRTP